MASPKRVPLDFAYETSIKKPEPRQSSYIYSYSACKISRIEYILSQSPNYFSNFSYEYLSISHNFNYFSNVSNIISLNYCVAIYSFKVSLYNNKYISDDDINSDYFNSRNYNSFSFERKKITNFYYNYSPFKDNKYSIDQEIIIKSKLGYKPTEIVKLYNSNFNNLETSIKKLLTSKFYHYNIEVLENVIYIFNGYFNKNIENQYLYIINDQSIKSKNLSKYLNFKSLKYAGTTNNKINKIYISGGLNIDGHFSSNIWFINCIDLSLNKLKYSSKLFIPNYKSKLCYHSYDLMKEQRIISFGGIDKFGKYDNNIYMINDINEIEISKIQTDISGREGHICVNTEAGVIIGLGMHKDNYLNDFYLFDALNQSIQSIYSKNNINQDYNLSVFEDEYSVYIYGGQLTGSKIKIDKKNYYKITQLYSNLYISSSQLIQVNGILYIIGSYLLSDLRELYW